MNVPGTSELSWLTSLLRLGMTPDTLPMLRLCPIVDLMKLLIAVATGTTNLKIRFRYYGVLNLTTKTGTVMVIDSVIDLVNFL